MLATIVSRILLSKIIGSSDASTYRARLGCFHGFTSRPRKRIDLVRLSRMRNRKGCSATNLGGIDLPVTTTMAAAASVPFSSTLMNALWITFPILIPPPLAMPEKSKCVKARLIPIAIRNILSCIVMVILNFGRVTAISPLCNLSNADVTDL